jgi:hypothetical protein
MENKTTKKPMSNEEFAEFMIKSDWVVDGKKVTEEQKEKFFEILGEIMKDKMPPSESK